MGKCAEAVMLCVLLFALSATAADEISSYVTDDAQIFTQQQRDALEIQLRTLEASTNGVQVVIFTEKMIPDDTTLEERTLALAEENKIGREGADNGILFYLAVDDRSFRWEVGYGVEDVFNTPWLGRMSRDVMVPSFAQGDYAKGVQDGIAVVGRVLQNSTDADVLRTQYAKETPYDDKNARLIAFAIVVFMTLAALSVISKAAKPPKGKGGRRKEGRLSDAMYGMAAGYLIGGMFRGGRGGFGGGFGGFSGGGGGFGGGGFSGGW